MNMRRWILLLLVASVELLHAGCAATGGTRTDRQVYRVPIDSERVLVLTEIVCTGAADADSDPGGNFAALRLEVERANRWESGGVVAHRTFERPAETRGFLRAGDRFDIYADAARRRFWLVNTATGNVFASLDCRTGEVTGPCDPPPEWTASPARILLGR